MRLSPAETRAAQEAGAVVVDIRPSEQRGKGGEIPGAREGLPVREPGNASPEAE